MTKLTAARALTSHIARRTIRIATIIAAIVIFVLFLLIWALAHYVSGWWWLLIIPVLFIVGMFILVRFFILFIILRIYPAHIRPDQRKALEGFTEKIEGLIEARGTSPQLFVLITIKDLILHKDVTTIKKIIRDSASLKRDFNKLERLF